MQFEPSFKAKAETRIMHVLRQLECLDSPVGYRNTAWLSAWCVSSYPAKRRLEMRRLALIFFICFGSILLGQPNAVAQQFSMDGTKHYVQSNDWNGLLNYGQAWTQAQPNNAEAWVVVGTARYNMNQFTEAIDAEKRATLLDPSLFPGWYALANAYNSMGTRVGFHDLAISAASGMEKTAKQDWEWFDVGQLYTYLGEITPSLYPKAAAAFLQVIKLNPKASNAWFNLGNIEWDMQNYSATVADFTKASQMGVPQATAQLNRLQGVVNDCAIQKRTLLTLPRGTPVAGARFATYNEKCAWLTGRIEVHIQTVP